jgi:hypothetical protein
MATNKKFRIQNGANIEGELSFNNQTVINNDGTVVASSVQPAITATVDKSFVDALNVSAFDALTAQSVTDISSFSTTDVSEGANLYFTEQRARGSFVGGTGVSYDDLTGEMSLDLTGGEGISVSGNEVSFDGSSISQDIVPSVDNTYSLGSPDKVWRDVYIGPGSLYINGTKILEDNNGTITMYADPGQVLSFGTSGGGNIDFNAGDATIDFKSDMVMLPGKTISTSGGNATEFGGDIEMSGNCIFGVAIPQTDGEAANKGYVDGLVNNPHSGDKVFNDDVTVGGNLTVQGTVTTVNSETISLADNIIDLNSNVISGAPSENGGIRVLRGDQNAAQIRWNEANDHWEMYDGSSWTKIALSTDDLAEGSNKYFTDERVNAIVGPIDEALQGADSAEKAARIAGDAVLQSAIDAEEAARMSADSDLGVAVAKNAADIVSGDSATLQSAKDYADGKESSLQIDIGLINDRDDAQDVAIAKNAADIVSGDSDTLASAKDYADGKELVLSGVDSDQGVLIAANAQAIADEATARSEADEQLQSAIDGLTGDLDGVEQDYKSADSDLSVSIGEVDAKVEAILGTSPEHLDTLQEIVAAFGDADAGIQGIVTDHGTRLTNAEADVDTLEINVASLSGSLTTLTGRVGDDEQDLADEIVRSTVADAVHDHRLAALEAADAQFAIDFPAGDSATLAAAKAHADAGDLVLQGQLGSLEDTVQALPIESGDSDTLAAAKAHADAGDVVLDTKIDNSLVTIRQEIGTGDDALNSALSVEVAARIAGDSDLDDKIDAEAVTRANADTDLQNQLNTLSQTVTNLPIDDKDSDVLAAAKAHADAKDLVLQGQIDNILANTDSDALNSLSEIVTAFQEADGTLTGAVSANSSAITQVSNDVSSNEARISSLEGGLQQAKDEASSGDSDLDDKIDAEIQARSNADTDLQNQINVLEGSVQALPIESGDSATLAAAKAYADTQDAATLVSAKAYSDSKEVSLQQEISSGDSALNDALVSGDAATLQSAKDYTDGREAVLSAVDSAQGVLISDNAQAILTEKSRAEGVESTLRSDLTSETQSRQLADSALQSNIDVVSGRVDAIIGTSPETLDTLQEIVTAFEGADGNLQTVITDNSSRLSVLESANTTRQQEIVSGDSDTLAAAKAHADAGDSVLDAKIDVEINARIAGDSALNDALTQEISDRIAGDDALQTQINNVQTEYSAGDSALNDALTQEISDRIAGDNALSSRLDSDRQERVVVDSDHNSRLSVLESDMIVSKSNDSDHRVDIDANALAISNEVTDRIAADGVLQDNIDTVSGRVDAILNGAGESLDTIVEIVSAFENADSDIQSLITNNASGLTAEESARIAADGVLQDNIDAEAVARANADTSLQNQIDALSGDVASLPIESGDSDTLAAAKAHADAQDAVTLAAAKAHADAHKATVEQGYSAGDSALNDALVAGDSATLASAKAYADAIEASGQAKDATQDTAIQANADAIAQEVSDRSTADQQLQSAINSLTSGLASARTDFGTGDSALNDAIQAVDSRVDAILDGSTVDLDSLKEVVDAFQGVDGNLQDLIDANTSRLTAAEQDIDDLELAMSQRVSEIGNINVDLSSKHALVIGLIDAEVDARIAGDSVTLASAKAHANTGDASLQSQLDSLQGSVQALPIESGDSDTLEAAKAYTDTKVAQGVTSSNSYTDGIAAPITNIQIPELKAADSDLDVRVTALEAEDVSLSDRLDSDRLEWIGADSALDARVTTLEDEMDTVESRLDSDRLEWIGADSDLNAKIEAETLRATGVEGGLQNQINNLLSNTDETALNSLAEIVTAFQGADGTLTGLVSSNAADIDTLQADVSGLQAINAGGRLNTAEGTLVDHGGRIGTLESEMNTVEQGLIDLPGQIKSDLSGGLCITYSPVTGVIEIDESEVRAQLVTHDADNLGGNDPSHYRINVYRVDGQLVN